MPELTSVAPTLYVRNVSAAAAHYRRLGFRTLALGDDHALARRDGVTLALRVLPVPDVLPTVMSLMISADDVDALREEWAPEKVGGEILVVTESIPITTAFMHIDPDGNHLAIFHGLPADDDGDWQ
jgi:hypothetical protein